MKVEHAYHKGVKSLKAKAKTGKAASASKNVDSKTGKRTGYGGKSFAELHSTHEKATKKK